jgi:hypothetical protein
VLLCLPPIPPPPRPIYSAHRVSEAHTIIVPNPDDSLLPFISNRFDRWRHRRRWTTARRRRCRRRRSGGSSGWRAAWRGTGTGTSPRSCCCACSASRATGGAGVSSHRTTRSTPTTSSRRSPSAAASSARAPPPPPIADPLSTTSTGSCIACGRADPPLIGPSQDARTTKIFFFSASA